jgi:hypothetical protein
MPLAYSKQRSWMHYSILQLPSVILPKARVFTSLTKPIPEDSRVSQLQVLTKLALLYRKRISESGEPWVMLVSVRKASVM